MTMSVQLLDKTRKINNLLHNNNSHKVVFNDICEVFNSQFDNVDVYNTICMATSKRQEETDKLSKKVDAMIIIGGANSSNTKKLYEIFDTVLTKREQEIIAKRYGLFGYKENAQRELAASMDISRSYVSRIEKKALEKLRKTFENDVAKIIKM